MELSDSLERLERLMAIEDALIERIASDASVSSSHRKALVREVEIRTESVYFPEGEDWKDNALADFVPRLGPKGPLGSLGASVRPGI